MPDSPPRDFIISERDALALREFIIATYFHVGPTKVVTDLLPVLQEKGFHDPGEAIALALFALSPAHGRRST